MEVVNGDYGGGWSLGWVGRRWGVCEMTREEGEGRGRFSVMVMEYNKMKSKLAIKMLNLSYGVIGVSGFG